MKKLLIALLAVLSLSAFAESKNDLYREIESLSIYCQTNDNICTGDKVLNGDSIREVELVDNTGRVVLKSGAGYSRIYIRNTEISKVVPSFGGYKAGDKVLKGDSIREVELVDNTGRVVLKSGAGYSRIYIRNTEISMIEACLYL